MSGSSNGNNVEIAIKGDASGLTAAGKQSEAALDGVRKAAGDVRQATTATSQAAKDYITTLERQAAQLGMTATQKRVYEAATKGASKADQDAVRVLSDKIEAHGRAEKAIQMVGRAAAVAGAAIGAGLVAVLKGSVTAAQEAEQAMLRLDAVYKASGGASGMTRGELDSMAESMKGRTGFDDDKIRGSMALLLTFRNVGRESFGEVMGTAADLSRVLGQDLNSSVMMLGKALENPEQGLTALSRAGVSFSETQKQNIKDMVETGRQAEAVTEILKTLREQGINGVAEAMNTGLFKATNDLSMAWDDLLKAIGRTDAVKGSTEAVFGSLATYLSDAKRVIEDGDWLDRLAFFTVGLTTPSMLKENQWEGSVGGKEARLAREAQEAQRQKGVTDQRTNFLRQFETPDQKMQRELANADKLFAGTEDLDKALAAVRAKYAKKGGSAPRDLFADTVADASGVGRDFPKQLAALKAGLDAGRISEEAYIGTVETLIQKQPFATKALQETIKELADKERVLNKADAAERAAADVLERADEAHAQRNEELRLEVELLGKNATERARLTAYRKIDAQLAKDEARLTDRLGKIGDLDGIDAGVAQLRAGADEAKAAWTDAHDTIETRSRSWLEGAKDGLQAYADEAGRAADAMAGAFKRGAQMAEDAIANFVVTGKLDIGSLVRYAATEMARQNFAKPLVSMGSDWLKGLFNGSSGGAGSMSGNGSVQGNSDYIYDLHSGGIAGSGEGSGRRLRSLAMFVGAPKYHGGGLAGDEVPAVLKRGEGVFTPGQMRALGGGGGSQSIRVEVVNPPGRPAEVESATPRFDAEGMVLTVVMREMEPGGRVARRMERQYGLNAAAGAVR